MAKDRKSFKYDRFITATCMVAQLLSPILTYHHLYHTHPQSGHYPCPSDRHWHRKDSRHTRRQLRHRRDQLGPGLVLVRSCRLRLRWL